MGKRNNLIVAGILLIILGIVMIYLGAFSGPKLLLPPIVTGIGFFVIAWIFFTRRS